MKKLLQRINKCTVCQPFFDHPCRPIMSAHPNARLCIIGQAPGRKVQANGKPWADKSGENLMNWLGISANEFYDEQFVALLPMGFCYPGSGKSGDLPPRKECAPLWHEQVLDKMNNIDLILLIGKYAQDYYLDNGKKNMTQTVMAFHEYLPKYFPLPHPSPRNFIWKNKNPWFDHEVVPALQKEILKLK